MIEVEHLTKKYGDLIAVNDLNFTIEKGKIWGLLGPNAAGKTTTMRILTGFLPATNGKARVAGFDVFENPEDVKKIMGYLPENVPLYPEMTVREYLHFVAEIKQVPSSQRTSAVEKAIEVSSLQSVWKRLIKNISRGYRQRVGIAQALIHDPEVLILDEPTIGLDPAQIREIRELIKSLKKSHTIILSTHILAEVTQTCDGVIIINEGRLMRSGSLNELTASFSKGKDGVLLKLRQTGSGVQSLLKNIPGVKNISLQDDGIKIEWSTGQDLRDRLVHLIAEKNLGLMEMRPLAMNIEDLYLRAVSGGVQQ
ncbi:MAG: ABC transporter ATP-binding protein [Candidatus Aminicenantes bacterium]